MKIRDIRTFPVRVGRGATTGGRSEFRYQLVVKVETDEGISRPRRVGSQRARTGGDRRDRSPARTSSSGAIPMQSGALWQEMYRSTYFEGDRTLTAAISAIDMALHDIRGKALGVPVLPAARRQASRPRAALRDD